MSVRVNALDHLVINVSDVARSTEWYRKILGMEVKVFDPGPGKTPRTSLVFGNQKINVRPRGADKVEWFTADHETAGSDDLCFLTSSTPDEVVAHLKANGVAIEEGPVAKQGARGTLRSVYCRDPDGSLIEISSYEDGAERATHVALVRSASFARSPGIHVFALRIGRRGCPGQARHDVDRRASRFAHRAVRWQNYSQARAKSRRKGCTGGIHATFTSQRRALSDHSQGSTCRGCCGCAPRAAATIRS